mmetsp:Transcript_24081/g.54034  ORF Transcript_24081/g.54034 Transcript_24081/m.54034 type:complete len:488 (+) Transcript_24081:71-1534(+)
MAVQAPKNLAGLPTEGRKRPHKDLSNYGYAGDEYKFENPHAICYRCSRPGHVSRDCPYYGSQQSSLTIFTDYDRATPEGEDHIKMLKISMANYSRRPARKQIEEFSNKSLQAPEGCNEYNIWYGKWCGQQWKPDKDLSAAPHRCCVRRDAGRTKADDRFGDSAYCCIFFARGCCALGSECTFLHRIPTPQDDKRLDMLHDIFGRDRHASDRDDMRGTGNFNKNNRTLYVGGLKILHGTDAAHKSLLRHFSEWGEIEQLRIIPNKAIGFITYRHRANAEFALEAMHCQTLDLDELLNLRWAYDDPNPKSKDGDRDKYQEQLVEALQEKGIDTTDTMYNYPSNYHIVEDPEVKRARMEGGMNQEGYSCDYPSTDYQYQSAYGPPVAPGSGDSNALSQLSEYGEGGAAGWQEFKDASGRSYFHNAATGETTWDKPGSSSDNAAPPAEAAPSADVDWSTAKTPEEKVSRYASFYGLSEEQAREWLESNNAL